MVAFIPPHSLEQPLRVVLLVLVVVVVVVVVVVWILVNTAAIVPYDHDMQLWWCQNTMQQPH